MKNNLFDQTEHDNKHRLWTVIIVFLTVVVFVLIIFGLYKINIIEIPQFVKDIFNKSESSGYTVKDYDDRNFLEFIRSEETTETNDNAVYIDLAIQDFYDFVASAPFVTEYSLTQNVDYYDADRKRIVYKNKIWVKDERYLVEIYDMKDTLTKAILCDGENVYVKDYITYDEPHVKTYPVSDMFTLENQVRLIDIRTLFETDDITEMIIELTRDEKSNLYTLKYSYADIAELTEVIKVSFAYGLIVDAETFYNDELIYRSNIDGKINVENIADDVFILK